jgi:hypothetical protein
LLEPLFAPTLEPTSAWNVFSTSAQQLVQQWSSGVRVNKKPNASYVERYER